MFEKTGEQLEKGAAAAAAEEAKAAAAAAAAEKLTALDHYVAFGGNKDLITSLCSPIQISEVFKSSPLGINLGAFTGGQIDTKAIDFLNLEEFAVNYEYSLSAGTLQEMPLFEGFIDGTATICNGRPWYDADDPTWGKTGKYLDPGHPSVGYFNEDWKGGWIKRSPSNMLPGAYANFTKKYTPGPNYKNDTMIYYAPAVTSWITTAETPNGTVSVSVPTAFVGPTWNSAIPWEDWYREDLLLNAGQASQKGWARWRAPAAKTCPSWVRVYEPINTYKSIDSQKQIAIAAVETAIIHLHVANKMPFESESDALEKVHAWIETNLGWYMGTTPQVHPTTGAYLGVSMGWTVQKILSSLHSIPGFIGAPCDTGPVSAGGISSTPTIPTESEADKKGSFEPH